MTSNLTLRDGVSLRQASLGEIASSCPTLSAIASFGSEDVRLETVTDRAEFDALETEWNALFERAGRSQQVFQTFGWNWHWCNHYLDTPAAKASTQLAIVTGRLNGRLVMVWPLVMERRWGLRILRFMGEPVSQYGDALVDNVAFADDLLAAGLEFAMSSLGIDIAALRKLRADAIASSALVRFQPEVTQLLAAPFMDFTAAASAADYELRFSSRDRKNRRRHRKRLSKRGPLTSKIHFKGAEAQAVARQAIAMKRIWLRERGLVSKAFAERRFEAFFESVALGEVDTDRNQTERPATSRDAGCLVSALWCGDRPAAIEIAIACKGRIASHIAAYDGAFERHSPGTLLLEDTFDASIKAGLTIHDFMAPADAYKLDWADGAVAVRDLAIVKTQLGSLYKHVVLGAGRRGAKYLIDHLPERARRYLTPCYAFLVGI